MDQLKSIIHFFDKEALPIFKYVKFQEQHSEMNSATITRFNDKSIFSQILLNLTSS